MDMKRNARRSKKIIKIDPKHALTNSKCGIEPGEKEIGTISHLMLKYQETQQSPNGERKHRKCPTCRKTSQTKMGETAHQNMQSKRNPTQSNKTDFPILCPKGECDQLFKMRRCRKSPIISMP